MKILSWLSRFNTPSQTNASRRRRIAYQNPVPACIESVEKRVLLSGQSPVFTSATSVTEFTGLPATFHVVANGSPKAQVTEFGTLPNGLSFDVASSRIVGTPADLSFGAYPIEFVATNSAGSASQSLMLTVDASLGGLPLLNQVTTKLTQPTYHLEGNVSVPGIGSVHAVGV